MAQTTSFSCDQCGAVKGETNHWLKIRTIEAFHVYPWAFSGEGADDDPAQRWIHVCGRGCAGKKLEEWLSR